MQLLDLLRIFILVKFQQFIDVSKSLFESFQGLFLFKLGLAQVAVLEVLSLL